MKQNRIFSKSRLSCTITKEFSGDSLTKQPKIGIMGAQLLLQVKMVKEAEMLRALIVFTLLKKKLNVLRF